MRPAALILLWISGWGASAQITVPGADGSDGVLNATTTNYPPIDLSLAATGSWDDPSPVPGRGVYDPEKWVVVFKYTSVNIGSSTTIRFLNHPSGAPVVWLVSGNVSIAGAINLDGTNPAGPSIVQGAPGGFRGGSGSVGTNPVSGGFGPGGGRPAPGGIEPGNASYATLSSTPSLSAGTYGNERIFPLVGGSGGAGREGNAGQSGAGAILIAASGNLTLPGNENTGVFARGPFNGNSLASGGGIRLIADRVTGTGNLRAEGGTYFSGRHGGDGRIRIEANLVDLSTQPFPTASLGMLSTNTAELFPPETAPSIRIVSIGGEAAPADPHASFAFPLQDVTLPNVDDALIVVEARNVPSSWQMVVRITPRIGQDIILDATRVSGDDTLSTWEATLVGVPCAYSAVQARAFQP